MSKNSRYVRLVLDNAVHYDDCVGEVEVLAEVRNAFDNPLVDESYYISSVDRAKQTKLSQGSPDVSCYDFPDGKPSGDVDGLAKLHRPDLDIVEVSEIVKESYEKARDSLSKDVENAKAKELARKQASDAMLSAQMDAITNKVVSTVQKSSNN